MSTIIKAPSASIGNLLGITTPAPILRTFLGNPLYTTPDELDAFSQPFFGQLDITDLVEKPFKSLPISNLFRPHKYAKLILSGRSIVASRNAGCDTAGLKLDTHGGRKKVTVESYLERIRIDRPDCCISLADEVDMNIGNKRLSKAIERSKNWYRELSHGVTNSTDIVSGESSSMPSFLFGVAHYNPNYPEQLSDTLKFMLASGSKGIVIGTAHMNETIEQRRQFIHAVKSNLPSGIPTLIQGADSLSDIAFSLAQGVDLISSNYPEQLASKGIASSIPPRFLTNVVSTQSNSANTGFKRSIEEVNIDRSGPKRARLEAENEHSQRNTDKIDTEVRSNGVSDTVVNCKYHMNLWDAEYERDIEPLVEGCQCHACKHHTRAYIHHLLLAKEMLAELLLFHHNQHQLLQLFSMAQHSIVKGDFGRWSEDLYNLTVSDGRV